MLNHNIFIRTFNDKAKRKKNIKKKTRKNEKRHAKNAKKAKKSQDTSPTNNILVSKLQAEKGPERWDDKTEGALRSRRDKIMLM